MTFPPHQGLILPVKLRWPRAIDGTALCIGAAAPDLAYPLGSWLNAQSHVLVGVVVWSLPVTVVLAALVRWRAADGVFANIPDLGPLRLRSYRVLGRRRPPAAVTVVSATIGSGSHVVIDGFTHSGRWGANALALNDVAVTAPLRGMMTEAQVLQYIGHVGGTVLFVWLLHAIGSNRRLEGWYGVDAVNEARRRQPTRGGPPVFWSLVIGTVILAVIAGRVAGRPVLFLAVLAAALSAVVVGTVVGSPGPGSAEAGDREPQSSPSP